MCISDVKLNEAEVPEVHTPECMNYDAAGGFCTPKAQPRLNPQVYLAVRGAGLEVRRFATVTTNPGAIVVLNAKHCIGDSKLDAEKAGTAVAAAVKIRRR